MFDQSRLLAILKLSLKESGLVNQSAGTTLREKKEDQFIWTLKTNQQVTAEQFYSPLGSSLSGSVLEFGWMLEFWCGFRVGIKLWGAFGLKLPLVLRFGIWVEFGLINWLILGFGQGEKGGRVGVWRGVLSWVSPSKVEMSAMRKRKTYLIIVNLN